MEAALDGADGGERLLQRLFPITTPSLRWHRSHHREGTSGEPREAVLMMLQESPKQGRYMRSIFGIPSLVGGQAPIPPARIRCDAGRNHGAEHGLGRRAARTRSMS